jgi:hypothetical protein
VVPVQIIRDIVRRHLTKPEGICVARKSNGDGFATDQQTQLEADVRKSGVFGARSCAA